MHSAGAMGSNAPYLHNLWGFAGMPVTLKMYLLVPIKFKQVVLHHVLTNDWILASCIEEKTQIDKVAQTKVNSEISKAYIEMSINIEQPKQPDNHANRHTL